MTLKFHMRTRKQLYIIYSENMKMNAPPKKKVTDKLSLEQILENLVLFFVHMNLAKSWL